jgi:hypothetical protein
LIVSNHQPQYIPWPGYFYKILKSDVFVLYDTVQYPRGKHFGNRNQVKTANGPTWLTVPVLRRSEMLPYLNIPVELPAKWADKHWRTLELSYARAPHFDIVSEPLCDLYDLAQWPNIAELNAAFLQVCLNALGAKTRVIRASEMEASHEGLKGADYILAILKELRATAYISGQGEGSLRYIEPASFVTAGIELFMYSFESPVYAQQWGEFIPDLSVVDMIASLGDNTGQTIMDSGVMKAWTGSAV